MQKFVDRRRGSDLDFVLGARRIDPRTYAAIRRADSIMDLGDKATRRLIAELNSGAHALATREWIGAEGDLESLDASIWKSGSQWRRRIERFRNKHADASNRWERGDLVTTEAP